MSRSDVQEYRLVAGGKGGAGELRAEKLRMAKYIFHNAAEFDGIVQLSVCLDCSNVSGRELLTAAISSAKLRKCMWLPVQDMRVSAEPLATRAMHHSDT